MMGARGPPGPPGPPVSTLTHLIFTFTLFIHPDYPISLFDHLLINYKCNLLLPTLLLCCLCCDWFLCLFLSTGISGTHRTCWWARRARTDCKIILHNIHDYLFYCVFIELGFFGNCSLFSVGETPSQTHSGDANLMISHVCDPNALVLSPGPCWCSWTPWTPWQSWWGCK